jgi:hypothetical protein
LKILYYLLGAAALLVGTMCFVESYHHIMTGKYEAATMGIFGGVFNYLAFVGCLFFASDCDNRKDVE